MSSSHHSPKASALLAQLRQFTGDSERYRHPLSRQVIYTPGVQFLAESAGAYWLIDAIASWLASQTFRQAIGSDSRIQYLHFWKLDVADDRTAVLTAVADQGEPAFIRQEITFTDFCLPKIELWCGYDGQYYTIYLPSEH